MIRFDGYYLEEPTKVINGRSKKRDPSYSFNSYLFNKDGFLLISSKHNYIELLNNFKKKDFNVSKSLKKEFQIEGNQLILKPSSKFGNNIALDIVSRNKLYNSKSDKYLHFISWEDSENSSKNVLSELLNSLDESKLKKYEE